MTRTLLMIAGAALALAGCDAATPVPDVAIGLNRPAVAPGQARAFQWSGRPGAAAYTVLVTSDRSAASPVAVSGFTATYALPVANLAWHEGHPLPDRSYFWTVRAYDRPDPQGLLLASSEPREFRPASYEVWSWVVQGP